MQHKIVKITLAYKIGAQFSFFQIRQATSPTYVYLHTDNFTN